MHSRWVVKFSLWVFNFLCFMSLELKTTVACDGRLGPFLVFMAS